MATNRALRDEAILHRIALNRHSTSLVRKVLAQLNRVDKDLVARLAEEDLSEASEKRLERLLESIRALQADGWTVLRSRLTSDLNDLARAEADFTGRLVSRAARDIGINPTFDTPSSSQVMAAVKARPFQGRFLREWLSDAEEGAARRVRESIRQGFIEGRSTADMVKIIRGTAALQFRDGILEVSRRGAETMVRTAVTHTANVAAHETYAAMGDLVTAVEWVSTLDARTSLICASRDGQVFPLNKGPRPPAHPNCRSTTIPRIKGLEPVERQSYAEWLKGQSVEVQDDILGRSKAILFRSGKLTLDRYVDRAGKTLTLDQLRATAGLAEELRVDSPVGPITAAEMAALRRYTSDGYETINGSLRGWTPATAATRDHVDALDTLLGRAALDEPTTVFRGVGPRVFEAYRQLRVGTTFTDSAFSSTSLSRDIAEEFFEENNAEGWIFTLRLPEGFRALKVTKASSVGEREREILIPRGVTWKVLSVDREERSIHLGPA